MPDRSAIRPINSLPLWGRVGESAARGRESKQQTSLLDFYSLSLALSRREREITSLLSKIPKSLHK
jgi:hypothetical protein